MTRTILFFTFFWISFVLAFPLSLVILAFYVVGLSRLVRRPLQRLARWWGSFVLSVMGVRLAPEGMDRIPSEGGLCFVGNHQGDLDILVALALIERPFGFIAKKEAIFLPFVGLWVVLLDGLFIDRKSARKALIAIKAGAQRIRHGGAMIIFPEGHRSRGPIMGDFRPGAFKLATMGDAAIVPVTFDGSYRAWEAETRIRKTTIRVVFHEPILTAGLSPEERKALASRVQNVIQSALPKD
ncbi:MAG: lysophospholipid acyltransferase family protein [Treponemataceae bacterium]